MPISPASHGQSQAAGLQPGALTAVILKLACAGRKSPPAAPLRVAQGKIC
jgi:hypothetical protein